MVWQWWYVPVFLGTVMLLWVLDVLRDIRDSLRRIEDLLEPRHDYEAEAGLPSEDVEGSQD
jgi:hypothetical protein